MRLIKYNERADTLPIAEIIAQAVKIPDMI
jgi:hypothetical protein